VGAARAQVDLHQFSDELLPHQRPAGVGLESQGLQQGDAVLRRSRRAAVATPLVVHWQGPASGEEGSGRWRGDNLQIKY